MSFGISSSVAGYSRNVADSKFVFKSGDTINGDLVVTGKLSSSITETLSTTIQLNYYELSSFNVTGTLSVTENITANNIIATGTITANNLNINNWNFAYDASTIVQTNSAQWSSITIPLTSTADVVYVLTQSNSNGLLSVNTLSSSYVLIPSDLNYNFVDGTRINITRLGTGSVTLSGDTGVIIKSVDNKTSLRSRYSTATVVKLSSNDWLLFGDIA